MNMIENEKAIKEVKDSDSPQHIKDILVAHYTKLDSFKMIEVVPDLSKFDDFHPIHAMVRG